MAMTTLTLQLRDDRSSSAVSSQPCCVESGVSGVERVDGDVEGDVQVFVVFHQRRRVVVQHEGCQRLVHEVGVSEAVPRRPVLDHAVANQLARPATRPG